MGWGAPSSNRLSKKTPQENSSITKEQFGISTKMAMEFFRSNGYDFNLNVDGKNVEDVVIEDIEKAAPKVAKHHSDYREQIKGIVDDLVAAGKTKKPAP